MTTRLELELTCEGFEQHSGYFSSHVTRAADNTPFTVTNTERDRENKTIIFDVEGDRDVVEGVVNNINDNPALKNYSIHNGTDKPADPEPAEPTSQDVVAKGAYDQVLEQVKTLRTEKQRLTEQYLDSLDEYEGLLEQVQDVTGVDPRSDDATSDLENLIDAGRSFSRRTRQQNKETADNLRHAMNIAEPTVEEVINYGRGDEAFLAHHLGDHDIDSWEEAQATSSAYHLKRLRDAAKERIGGEPLSEADLDAQRAKLNGLQSAYEADPEDEQIAGLITDIEERIHGSQMYREANQRLDDMNATDDTIHAVRDTVAHAQQRYKALNDTFNGLGTAHITYTVEDTGEATLAVPGDQVEPLRNTVVAAFTDAMPEKARLTDIKADDHAHVPVAQATYDGHSAVARTAKDTLEQLGLDPEITYEHRQTI
jgi:hypothetical protein